MTCSSKKLKSLHTHPASIPRRPTSRAYHSLLHAHTISPSVPSLEIDCFLFAASDSHIVQMSATTQTADLADLKALITRWGVEGNNCMYVGLSILAHPVIRASTRPSRRIGCWFVVVLTAHIRESSPTTGAAASILALNLLPSYLLVIGWLGLGTSMFAASAVVSSCALGTFSDFTVVNHLLGTVLVSATVRTKPCV